MKKQTKKSMSLKALTKSTVWDLQENDVFRMLEAAHKDVELRDSIRRYVDIIKTAFEMEEVTIDKPEVVKKYQARGFKVSAVKTNENTKTKFAVKKRPILRVTDLTYENIRHISASKLIEVLDRNFGGGWESLSQSIRDIIESGFEISTTTLPKDRLHKKGGLYEKKLEDGFEVLEIPKGLWTEAIFAKVKPVVEKPRMKFEDEDEDFDHDEDENMEKINEFDEDEEDDDFDDDKLTEESYRTTFDENPEDLSLDAEEVAEDEEF
ncbi:MAG: hypothetical protein IJ605_00605 [Prevotella sp.]|nr:hypothetical protein [Prevotella sp.]